MVKIAFLLLCHRAPDSVIAQARALTAAGDVVAVHFDKRGSAADFMKLRTAFDGDPSVALCPRVACGWGEYSLVQASLNMLLTARAAFSDVTHYYLMSGDCYPSKSAAHVRRRLAPADRDYIETADFLDSDWIKTGMREERLIYRHYFNEREQSGLFYRSMEWQRRLGIRRKTPEGVRIRIGSQWWLLRASTVEAMFRFMKKRPDVVRFFRNTWIPDEIMFQTIAYHCVPREEIMSHPPTTLIFSDYGMPAVFYRDHFEMLKGERRFFARKITPNDPAFRDALLDNYVNGEDAGDGEDMIGVYYGYLAGRGRTGRRAAPRFWQRSAVLDDSKEVLVVAAKKWHLGRAFAEAASRICGVSSVGYVFDDEAPLPLDLGHLEVVREKRGRHRRAFLGLLFDAMKTRKLMICLDPSRDDVVSDFAATDARMRVLMIDQPFAAHEYDGHAHRIGLLGRHATEAQRRAVTDALRVEFAEESGRLRKVDPGRMSFLSSGQSRVENTAAVARFLRADRHQVEAVVREMEKHL